MSTKSIEWIVSSVIILIFFFCENLIGFVYFFDFNNPNDIFNAFNNRYKKTTFYQENLDIQYNISLTLEDIYNNREFQIKYHRRETCPTCQGSGQDKNSGIKSKCTHCHNGKDSFGFACEYCGGTGSFYNKHCKTCKGSKTIEKEMIFSLNNVYKITGDVTKYLKNYGHQSKQIPGKFGKLILNIKYSIDEQYRITNKGLIKKLNLHFEDAIKGNPYEFKHLDGKTLKVKIPKGTKDGDLIRLPNQGVLINQNTRNDMIFSINIIIDYSRITEEE
jgi:molecular chaperone DnaJ